jgi:hypothetical protein
MALREIYSRTFLEPYVVVARKWIFWREVDFIDSDTAYRSPKNHLMKTSAGPRLRMNGEPFLNGTLMFVVDPSDVLIIGKPSKQSKHPNLIGGRDPRVKAAGEIFFRNGLIYEVRYNQTGHFATGPETEPIARERITSEFPKEMFHQDFKGFLDRNE